MARWWSFEELDQSSKSLKAAETAAQADLIVFSLSPVGDLPAGIRIWIENWLARRHEREGALVGLVEGQQQCGGAASTKEIYLRQVARRAGMDYVSHVAPTSAKGIPDSLDSFTQRAGVVTSLLDEIIHTYPQPPAL